ncbi:uncharacterized protein LOC117104764 [Anneissia japonica]|uniref:uncharacterized protein LOC117104764 n=1 Tax=Anneissia japonica TaxID=1529436 RepID=UPI0014259705|nr:uncharacterized protein LOC117104764 [Anneissia japonica]
MKNVKFIVLLLLIVVCDSSCPSTWYAIPDNRCIKVIFPRNVAMIKIHTSKLCEKYTIGTKVASYISVTSPMDMAILNKFSPWIQNFYLDWNYVGSNYYYSDGGLIDIVEYSLTDITVQVGDCVGVSFLHQGFFADCLLSCGYVCEIKL